VNRDSTTDYFSDGMAEELISALGRLRGLRVASRTSTFAMKGHVGGLAEVGAKLGVQTVLEGSVRRYGDQVRVNARLVDVARDSTLWDGEYTNELKNVLFVQDSLARSIVSALNVALGGPGPGLSRPQSPNTEAYDEYLRGRYFLGRRNPRHSPRRFATSRRRSRRILPLLRPMRAWPMPTASPRRSAASHLAPCSSVRAQPRNVRWRSTPRWPRRTRR